MIFNLIVEPLMEKYNVQLQEFFNFVIHYFYKIIVGIKGQENNPKWIGHGLKSCEGCVAKYHLIFQNVEIRK